MVESGSCFFEKVHLILHPGYNIGYWNLHERMVEQENSRYLVNRSFPLVFFHIISVSLKEGILFYRQQDRFEEDILPLVKKIFNDYRAAVPAEGYESTNLLPSCFANLFNQHDTVILKKIIRGRMKRWIKKNISANTRNKFKETIKNLIDSQVFKRNPFNFSTCSFYNFTGQKISISFD